MIRLLLLIAALSALVPGTVVSAALDKPAKISVGLSVGTSTVTV